MKLYTVNPLDSLLEVIDQCSELHASCKGCLHIVACRELWDRASEQAYARLLTIEQLCYYISEFNKFHQDEYTDISVSLMEYPEDLFGSD